MSEVQDELSGHPAASEVKFTVASGGSVFSGQTGIQVSGWFRKFCHTLRSFLIFSLFYALNPFSLFAKHMFRLYLNVDKKGHIVEMKFSLPSRDWSCSVLNS